MVNKVTLIGFKGAINPIIPLDLPLDVVFSISKLVLVPGFKNSCSVEKQLHNST